ncbi:MAG: FtsK/SpoIIIE family DNA translocase [Armatimonadota bacterium]
MTTPATRRPRAKPRPKPAPARETPGKPVGYEIVGIGLIAIGILLIAASYLESKAFNLLLHAIQVLFGTFGAWGIAVAAILLGIFLLIRLSRVEFTATSLGMAIIFLAAISLAQLRQEILWNPRAFAGDPGGFFGSLIANGLDKAMGKLAWVVLVAVGIAGISIATEVPLTTLFAWPFKMLYRAACWAFAPLAEDARLRRQIERAERVAELKEEEANRRNRPIFDEELLGTFPQPAAKSRVREPEPFTPEPEPEPFLPEPPAPAKEPAARVTGVPSREDPDQLQFADEAVAPKDKRPYVLPPIDLLSLSPNTSKNTRDDSAEKIVALEQVMSSFGIDAKVVEVERGPRVTRFEIVPPPGIRINRITNLADNIALSLKALDVRVEAPVPGKGVVGIEVPNRDLVMVDLRDVVDSDAAQKTKSPLAFALGRDISGHPRLADLSRMPHLLIAGATNSGKSVCINSLICSILMRATPMQVKFLMVDPKRVELSLFQSIPHLIAPVAHDAKHAAGLLRWAIREMEQRYEMFAEKCVRNILGFNEQSRLEKLEELPYIVIIIDELADLMMQAAAEFEASICRIAQLARATGIHLVVATQRPSVNVITGTIKANIPSRIAFAVASQVDSRTILDMNGAERLVGQGDMLYLPVEASKPTRIQGAYVNEKDINRIVEHVKAQAKPAFTDEIMAIEEEALRETDDGSYGGDEPDDELFDRALNYIRTTKYASTSMLQRKFRIGYTRAARLMDSFEERGYVGPGQGSKPREVIYAPSSSVVGRPAAERLSPPADDEEAPNGNGDYLDDLE